MPVALEDHRFPVELARGRPLSDLHRLRAEPHRAAEVLDAFLLRQEVDDRERRLRIHLRRVGAVETDDVAGELRTPDVHGVAVAEAQRAALAPIAAGANVPL